MSDCVVTEEQSGVLIGNGFHHYESGDVVHLTGPNGSKDIHINDLPHVIEEIEVGTDPTTGGPICDYISFDDERGEDEDVDDYISRMGYAENEWIGDQQFIGPPEDL